MGQSVLEYISLFHTCNKIAWTFSGVDYINIIINKIPFHIILKTMLGVKLFYTWMTTEGIKVAYLGQLSDMEKQVLLILQREITTE